MLTTTSAPVQTGDRRLPFHERHARTNLLLVFNEAHQCFGTFTGRVRCDSGEWISIDGLEGWAEDVVNRW